MPDDPLDLTVTPPEDSSAESTEITVGTGSLPDFTTPFMDNTAPPFVDAGNDGYHAWGCSVDYVRASGISWSPKAAPEGTAAAFWRCHSGWCMKVVSFVCQRIGSMPVAPHPENDSNNEVLLGSVLTPCKPDDLPNRGEIFTLVGAYCYLVVVPPDYSTPLPVPGSPLRGFAPHTLNLADFSKQLMPPIQVANSFAGNKKI